MRQFPLLSSMSIRDKIVLGTILVAFVFAAFIITYSQSISNVLLNETAKRIFESSSNEINLELQRSYAPVDRATTLLASSQFNEMDNIDDPLLLVPSFSQMLEKLPSATGIQVGSHQGDYFILRYIPEKFLRDKFNAPDDAYFVADYLQKEMKKHIRYFFNNNVEIIGTEALEDTGYDPRIRPWYLDAMASDDSITTSPYVFYFMKEIGITIAKANQNKTLVIATDITLSNIAKKLKENPITHSSASLIHNNQEILAWSGDISPLVQTPDKGLRQRTISELEHPIFSHIGRSEDKDGWLVHRSRLDFSGTITPELIVAIPKDDLLANYLSLKNQMYIISVMLLIMLIAVTWYLAKRISDPLSQLHKSIEDVSNGNFNFTLPDINSNDEVGDLVVALHTMKNSIKQHINDLANAKVAKKKLESELEIARKIQMSMVPGAGNLNLALPEYNIDARLLPAKAVGGDLYIAIALPNGKYFIAVGDVSDKGVPAALFMSRAVSLAKLLVPKSISLSDIVSELNDELAEDNDECMFITFFCAVLDPSDSRLTVACAGHNPPVLIKSSGDVSFIEVEAGSPLGLFENGEYKETQVDFYVGDKLVIYTDGITEAFNEEHEEFSDEKLLETLEESKSVQPINLISEHVLEQVSKFAGNEPQSDDITLFILEKIQNG
ncbi:SpoIIE family protein phosphatase [Kangiella sediminilitoris]|uniref:Protein serine/threonine phosphatase n=1 Tax=Kangiella sediminilitoris TaxID=1144748 RepID=A0A1B3B8Y9_9GAMM|nr:SpoIIE family protein phosphatase [Kangiella sediminilitoris]AOE49216.1 hypothetical protein KS2013_492 [Kangiella sediminilitoris]